ncbi:MAG: cell wall hydrolase [Pseudobutyrivibrio sp.]|nr:cell wall hydrolase [Pseudobutyrivibrio sp.]
MISFTEVLTAVYAKCKSYITKRTMQAGALTLALVMLFAGAYAYAPVEEIATTEVVQGTSQTVGVFAAVSQINVEASESARLMSESSEVTVVAATTDQVEPDQTNEYDEWSDKVMADVNEYLYIRSDDNPEAEPVGKLRAGDIATLVDVYDGWYEIESGNAHGFVSADFCVTGIEAYELAMDVCDTYATTDVAGLRIRSEASEDSKILKVVSKGTKLVVDTDVEEVDGWVAVSSAGTSGYVKGDYVQVDMETGEAITLEEEAAAIEAARKAAEEAKAKAEAAAAANQAIIDSADDITLMAAIIQIEAGSELYEGQVAVGSVVMNRVRSGSYPNTIGGVIFARGQFATSRMSSVISKGPKASCIQAAMDAMAGVDTTGGATHFRRAGNKAGLIIGHHVFY